MSIEVFHFSAQDEQRLGPNIAYLRKGQAAFAADYSVDPMQIVFVTCNLRGLGELYSVFIEDVEGNEAGLDIGNAAAAKLFSRDNKIAEVEHGETHDQPYINVYREPAIMVVRNIGDTAVRPKWN
ncbi:hypothetical protein COY17_01535 [Candidatus Saccharibacteria bacterium CG_4_10_14_0_2_um_filter_52_9]|nr:MAG: hypothetical protein COY17_01535 [Candidatus Saccharibacteria bacterium CG_4_10_14_0_2_um_filter_52_9]